MTKLVIVICSSDIRKKFLPICIHFIRKYVCREIQIFVIGLTEKIQLDDCKIIIHKDSNKSWGNRLLLGLKKIEGEDILLITEDILFGPSYGYKDIYELYQIFKNNNLNILQLANCFKNNSYEYEFLPLSNYSLYRVSVQPTLYKRSWIINHSNPNENIWDFEISASLRSRGAIGVYGMAQNHLNYLEVIKSGKLTRKGYHLIKKEGLIDQINGLNIEHPLTSFLISLKYKSFVLFSRIFNLTSKYSGL